MKVQCPFCGVPIQYYKPTLPDDFKCPACSNPFTLETVSRKKKYKEELLKRKLHELYIGSQRPCSSGESIFQAILLIALAAGRTDLRDAWENADCPTTLDEIRNTLSLAVDYDPDEVIFLLSTNRERRQSAARLISLLAEFHSDAFEGHGAHMLQGDIVRLIRDQLSEERDMRVVELLCYVLSYWHEHMAVQDIALNTLLDVANSHGEAIFNAPIVFSYIKFLHEIIPEAREMFSFIDLEFKSKFKSHQEAVEALKLLLTDKLKTA